MGTAYLSRQEASQRRSFSWGQALATLLLLLTPAMLTPAIAQDEELAADELFEQARELAFDDRREEARELLRRALERSPGYHDVRVFLARTYMWDRRWDDARPELTRVLAERPDMLDARLALIDVELWNDYPGKALELADAGLAMTPEASELHLRRARALRDLERYDEALQAARQASRGEPENLTAINRLVRALEPLALPFKLSVGVTREEFDGSRDPWTDVYVQLGHRQEWGTIYGRANYAHRFGRSAEQLEIDAYPKLGSGRYLYLNAGISDSGIFPDLRLGAEIHQGLPKSFEASLGFRYLDFSPTQVWLYTGSIGRYAGDYFIWLRPYVSNKAAGTSLSLTLFVRRFFGDPESYVTVSVEAGDSPDAEIVTQDVTRLESRRARLEAQKLIRGRWVLKGKLGWREQELTPTNTIESWLAGFAVERFF